MLGDIFIFVLYLSVGIEQEVGYISWSLGDKLGLNMQI